MTLLFFIYLNTVKTLFIEGHHTVWTKGDLDSGTQNKTSLLALQNYLIMIYKDLLYFTNYF